MLQSNILDKTQHHGDLPNFFRVSFFSTILWSTIKTSNQIPQLYYNSPVCSPLCRLGMYYTPTSSLQRRKICRQPVSLILHTTTQWCYSSSGNLGIMEYPFIAITPKSTQTRSGSTIQGLIYGSIRTVQSFPLHTWNCLQTKEWFK